ncbi:hypothetical protein V6N11_054093 [Hibiscus sabdariffa]|uniref:Uncharacterized protein n=1 Tax=Hibiscus sabdariffa TaxID=183260 RepID=A0ABR2S354_9ROSI
MVSCPPTAVYPNASFGHVFSPVPPSTALMGYNSGSHQVVLGPTTSSTSAQSAPMQAFPVFSSPTPRALPLVWVHYLRELMQAPRIDYGPRFNDEKLPNQETIFSPLVQNEEPGSPSEFSRQSGEEVRLPQSDLRFPSASVRLENFDSLRATAYESQEDQSGDKKRLQVCSSRKWCLFNKVKDDLGRQGCRENVISLDKVVIEHVVIHFRLCRVSRVG